MERRIFDLHYNNPPRSKFDLEIRYDDDSKKFQNFVIFAFQMTINNFHYDE